jgi:hypothetical protein
MNRTMIRSAALAAALLALGGCDTDKGLAVTNPNQGDTKRVLGTPNDAENLLGSYYRRWSSGVYGSTADLQGMANMMSLQNYSSLANNCQNARAPFSGASNANNPGNGCAAEQYRLYNILAEVNRVASSFLRQMKPVADGGAALTLGTPARDARAKAFAEFLRGLSIGYVAMMHDSLAIVTDAMDGQDPGVLVSAAVAFDSADAAFERAINYTRENALGSDGFPIPATWFPAAVTQSKAEFERTIRSYRARIRANMARTNAERNAVDWVKVIADVDGGITSDHLITTNTVTGPTNAWRSQYGVFGLWHQMPPFFIGMADTSGAYAAWIAQEIGDRGSTGSFTLATPDTRFPRGANRAAQQAAFVITSCQAASTPCPHYFVNRPTGGDQSSGAGWGWSNYDFVRFHSWRTNGDGTQQNGNTPFMVKAEMDLLKAEGLYRQGQYAAAGAIVNFWRNRNGLPQITQFDATSPVPGTATSCIPKVPKPPTYRVVGCGTLWDALKYEKRMETAYTHYSAWYLDGRGWDDLPKDTPLWWPVPFQDLQARGRSIDKLYGTGLGAGNAPGSASGPSSYGW